MNEQVAQLTDLMRRGRSEEAETRIAELTSEQDDDEITRDTVLALVIAEPQVHGALVALEQWLDGTVDAPSAAPLGAWWALPAAELDVPAVTHDARLYIDSYPKEGLVIGHLLDRCSDWLVRRVAMTFDHVAKLPRMRTAILMLAEASGRGFPTTSAALEQVVTDVDDDTLWASLIRQVAHAEMQRPV